MCIVHRSPHSLKPYKHDPRMNNQVVDAVAESLRKYSADGDEDHLAAAYSVIRNGDGVVRRRPRLSALLRGSPLIWD